MPRSIRAHTDLGRKHRVGIVAAAAAAAGTVTTPRKACFSARKAPSRRSPTTRAHARAALGRRNRFRVSLPLLPRDAPSRSSRRRTHALQAHYARSFEHVKDNLKKQNDKYSGNGRRKANFTAKPPSVKPRISKGRSRSLSELGGRNAARSRSRHSLQSGEYNLHNEVKNRM